MKKDYQILKGEAVQKAIDWQYNFDSNNYDYYDLMLYDEYFTKLAKRYGLIKEFKENGII